MQGAEEKVSEGVSSLAEVRRKGGEEREQSAKALQAQQAATQAAQHQLQAAQVPVGLCLSLAMHGGSHHESLVCAATHTS